ncbi:MAG: sulfur carrier protein ThiS [Bacteroides sp.]|nr:sulfur carrier protein ThiS [Bacteroides sp.]MCM1389391.1 sulfur carrier protein ThiS [Bacteroides sp.]
MEIKVNNELRTVNEGVTVADVAGKDAAGVAVAVNGKIVRKPDWGSTTLNEGDDVVVIRAAYGG